MIPSTVNPDNAPSNPPKVARSKWMEDIKEIKLKIRQDIKAMLEGMPKELRAEKTQIIGEKLLGFANFLEAKIALLYINGPLEIETRTIIEHSYEMGKIVVLPAFDPNSPRISLMKVDDPDRQLKPGPRGTLEPDPEKCKMVPTKSIDIAIIPGTAFDEKGGRVGAGWGYYDRMIPKLPITTRKVSITLEDQIISQIPMESHDKYVDIIITDKRIIYKI
jgi:5-formyltetrahydrofolate cyclo-ligase